MMPGRVIALAVVADLLAAAAIAAWLHLYAHGRPEANAHPELRHGDPHWY